MAETTKTNTGALDVGAMYQAGAAGVGTKKATTESGDSFIKQLGRYALSYYMQSKENLRKARTEESNIFATVEAQALDSGLVLEGVEATKNKLTEANTILNSARWSLFQGSDKYKEAEQNKTEALAELTNLKKAYDEYPVLLAEQTGLANRTTIGKGPDGSEVTIGFSNGSTAIEIFNSSLFVDGTMGKALSWDPKKGIMVNIAEIGGDGPYTNVSGEKSWDNPATPEIETKETAYGEGVTQVRLKDMQFAIAENPTLSNFSYDYVNGMSAFGGKGGNMTNESMRDTKQELFNKLRGLSKEELADSLFKKDQWTNSDGESMSLVEGLIFDGSGFKMDDELLAGLDALGDVLDDGVIDANELAGIQELIKYNIKDGEYKVDSLVEMIHEKGVQRYENSYKKWRRANPKALSAREQSFADAQYFVRRIDAIEAKAISTNNGHKGGSFLMGVDSKNRAQHMRYMNGGETFGTKDPVTGKYPYVYGKGWHLSYWNKDTNTWHVTINPGADKRQIPTYETTTDFLADQLQISKYKWQIEELRQ